MQLHKAINPTEVKFDDEAGTVQAVFATLNVIDKDGDVTLPGFFGSQEVAIAWAHDRSRLVGKGRISEAGEKAILSGTFFLETEAGKEAYLTTKAMGDLQEWSYGFYILEGGSSIGQKDDRRVRFLQPKDDGSPGSEVAEVSPVLVGAGEGTATIGIKSDGLRFVDQAEQVAQAVELLLGRAGEIAEMRSEKGKTLGDEAVAKLISVKTRIENAATQLGDLVSAQLEEEEAEKALLDPAAIHSAKRAMAAVDSLLGGR